MLKPNVNVYIRLRNEKGLSNYRVHKETGIAQQTLSAWEKGKYYPKKDKIDTLAEFFGVSSDLFYHDEVTSFVADAMEHIAEQTFEVAAGQGRINDEYGASDAPIANREFSRVVVRGDSMLPSLRDGDQVMVKHITDDIIPADFVVVKINGDESTIKHVEYAPDGIWLKAENKEVYPDKFFSIKECTTLPVQIIGKAVEIVSRKL